MESTKKPSESGRRGRQDLRYALHLLRRNPIVLAGVVLSAGAIVVALLSPLLVNPTAWQQQPLNLRLCWNNPLFTGESRNIFKCSGAVYPLGTDVSGRSLLQMIILAIPIDLKYRPRGRRLRRPDRRVLRRSRRVRRRDSRRGHTHNAGRRGRSSGLRDLLHFGQQGQGTA